MGIPEHGPSIPPSTCSAKLTKSFYSIPGTSPGIFSCSYFVRIGQRCKAFWLEPDCVVKKSLILCQSTSNIHFKEPTICWHLMDGGVYENAATCTSQSVTDSPRSGLRKINVSCSILRISLLSAALKIVILLWNILVFSKQSSVAFRCLPFNRTF